MNMNPYSNYNMMGLNGFNNYNQFQPQLNQPQISTQNLIRVNGIDGAKAYQMSANSTVALFDTNEDIMYVKSTDGAGFPSIRTFSFTEIKENTKVSQNTDYISRQEFEDFKKELMNNGKQSISRSKSNLTDKSSSN